MDTNTDSKTDPRIFYGPHACSDCKKLIVKASREEGGAAFDQPDGPIYPNTEWQRHNCQPNHQDATEAGHLPTTDCPTCDALDSCGIPRICEPSALSDGCTEDCEVNEAGECRHACDVIAPPSVSQEGGMPTDTLLPEIIRHFRKEAQRERVVERELLADESETFATPMAEECAKEAARLDGYASHLASLASLRQQLADAILTARYQSDVARQADDAREKAVEARANIAVVLFRRHQRLSAAVGMDPGYSADGTIAKAIERLASLQAENAGLRAGGVGLIAAERQRQIEGSSDDDRYNSGQLAQSAHGLLETALGLERDYIGFPLSCARKLARRHAGNPIKLLTIAGAFIAAEIDRLNRATPTPPQERP
jgi:hypothetical protein